jgi:formyltetrahydrofolate-dependent phosphoribosylglycinamide formyltransferase
MAFENVARKRRVAILISGRGSNMRALTAAAADEGFPAVIVAVISNRADAEGLAFARASGIPTHVISHKAFDSREAFDAALDELLLQTGAEIICLAGFMRLFSAGFITKWEGRLINIHPALLPSFKGLNPQSQALAAGVRISGCTVHFVVLEMDSGPIIGQSAVPVLADDTPETLGARILREEHQLYPTALRMLATGDVKWDSGRVAFTQKGARLLARLSAD